jgi:hypothetical protein
MIVKAFFMCYYTRFEAGLRLADLLKGKFTGLLVELLEPAKFIAVLSPQLTGLEYVS